MPPSAAAKEDPLLRDGKRLPLSGGGIRVWRRFALDLLIGQTPAKLANVCKCLARTVTDAASLALKRENAPVQACRSGYACCYRSH